MFFSEYVSGSLYIQAWAGTFEPDRSNLQKEAPKKPLRIMLRCRQPRHLQEPACLE
jgi:hypothetical protein